MAKTPLAVPSDMSFVPSEKILNAYARVLVNYALNSGAGVKPGEVVQCVVPDVAKPLLHHLHNVLLQSGALPIIQMLPTGFDRDYFTLATHEQLTFFPRAYQKARVNTIDHQIYIIADHDPHELDGIDPQKVTTAQRAKADVRKWLTEKETAGKFTWTLGLWGVPAKAHITGMTMKEYWQQIIRACFLDEVDPIAKWRNVAAEQEHVRKALSDMKIEWVHIQGADVDLHVQLGATRRWNGGSGRNIPSFEIFTSPDWRGTHGWIRFNQPLYRFGQVLEGIELHFDKGLISQFSAAKGKKVLAEVLKTENANKLGEFSLTDKRMSRITKFMAETLFDENIGGPFGNTHVAFGMSYHDCYAGDASKVTKQQWAKMGFNYSVEHTDIISTTDRTVTATLANGSTRVIYKDGMFTV